MNQVKVPGDERPIAPIDPPVVLEDEPDSPEPVDDDGSTHPEGEPS